MPDAPISFSGFRFDPPTGELTGPNGAVRLGPQPAKVLAMLALRPGELVTRAEIKDALWPDTVVEADQGLNFCIRQVRAALGDEADAGRFIETLPKRGYRFIAKIDGAQPATTATTSAPTTGMPVVESRRGRRAFAAAIAGIIMVGAVWAFAASGRSGSRNVAIMPLIPQAGDPSWVSDIGSEIVERLVVQLTARAPGTIGVIGPLTTQRLIGDTRPLVEIGRSLNVGYMMSGSVRASDSTLFVQVVRTADGRHVCAFRRRVIGVNLDTLVALIVNGTAEKILALRPGEATDFRCAR